MNLDKIQHKEENIVSICAWCDTDKRLTEVLAKLGYRISHGICKICRDKLKQSLKQ